MRKERTDGKPFYRAAVLLVCLLAAAAFISMNGCAKAEKEPELTVANEKKIISYADNSFLITAPEAGKAVVTVRDPDTIYRVLEFGVAEGENHCAWDGLAYQEERLKSKAYQIETVLYGESGRTWEKTYNTYVEYSAQALIFALPSADTVYMEQTSEWFLEAKTVLSGEITAELTPEGRTEPAYSWKRQVSGGKIIKMAFTTLTGKTVPEPGKYTMKVYATTNPAYSSAFSLEVREGTEDAGEIRVTGDIMPSRDDTDAEIWEKMRMPATVVDIGITDHQKVYAEPDAGSTVLGTLHGQSQALSVLDISGGWVRIGAWNHEEGAYIEGWVPENVLKISEPQGNYGLLLDKKYQTITVFRDGERLDTLLVSTGRMEKDELYQETAAGSFLTGQHRVDFSTNGLKYDHVIQYDGGNLLHQIPYAWGKQKQDYTPGKTFLGTKASHACIRIQAEPGENGLNAYWIWTHIQYHTRLIILDDPEEREKEKILVTGNTPEYDADMLVNSDMDDEHTEGEDEVIITFGGDAALGGREAYFRREDSIIAKAEADGIESLFSGISGIIGSDDCTSVNLECVLKDTAEGEDAAKTWRFRGLTEYAKALKPASVELVNTANNHTIDYGEAGMASTLAALEGNAEICGNGINTVLEIKGHKIGFGGCRETTYISNTAIIGRDIAELKKAGCEFIIYQCHWGTEYSANHNATQEAMARACARAGADLVIGHHPHVVQGIDIIDGMPVIYSLGNLIFGGTIELKTYDAMLARVRVKFGEAGTEVRIRLIPVLTSSRAEEGINDYTPAPAGGEDKTRILRAVQADTPFAISENISVND